MEAWDQESWQNSKRNLANSTVHVQSQSIVNGQADAEALDGDNLGSISQYRAHMGSLRRSVSGHIRRFRSRPVLEPEDEEESWLILQQLPWQQLLQLHRYPPQLLNLKILGAFKCI